MTFKNGLIACLKSELLTFGEDAIFRNAPIKILRGTSTQTKNMRIAGFYKEESFDVVILHPEESITDEAISKSPPQVNEVISFEGLDFRIREIEVLEYSHGFKLILEKLI